MDPNQSAARACYEVRRSTFSDTPIKSAQDDIARLYARFGKEAFWKHLIRPDSYQSLALVDGLYRGRIVRAISRTADGQ